MIEIIKELRTIDGQTLFLFAVLLLVGLYIFLNGIALIIKSFKK